MLGTAHTATSFDKWLRIGTLDGGKVHLPLRSYSYHDNRTGNRSNTVQVNTDRDGQLVVGVITDVTEPFKHSRTTYQPLRDAVTIDFGLSTLVATNEGDLMGRSFIDRLAKIDKRIDGIARIRQHKRGRVRKSGRGATTSRSRNSGVTSRPRSTGCWNAWCD